MNSVINVLASIVGPTQLGGWVRSGFVALGAFLATKYGMQYWDSADVIGGLGTAVSAIVVGLWSSLAKTAAASPTTPAP